jgi:hypothetical protein
MCSVPAAAPARPSIFEPSIAIRSPRSARLCLAALLVGPGNAPMPKLIGLFALPPVEFLDRLFDGACLVRSSPAPPEVHRRV